MWWKIYFWGFLILTAMGLIGFFGRLTTWSLGDWFEVTSSIIAIIALYAYVFKKNILSGQFWKIIFWITIPSWVFNIFYTFTPLQEAFPLPVWLESKSITDGTTLLISILLGLPLAYALYKLGQKKLRESK